MEIGIYRTRNYNRKRGNIEKVYNLRAKRTNIVDNPLIKNGKIEEDIKSDIKTNRKTGALDVLSIYNRIKVKENIEKSDYVKQPLNSGFCYMAAVLNAIQSNQKFKEKFDKNFIDNNGNTDIALYLNKDNYEPDFYVTFPKGKSYKIEKDESYSDDKYNMLQQAEVLLRINKLLNNYQDNVLNKNVYRLANKKEDEEELTDKFSKMDYKFYEIISGNKVYSELPEEEQFGEFLKEFMSFCKEDRENRPEAYKEYLDMNNEHISNYQRIGSSGISTEQLEHFFGDDIEQEEIYKPEICRLKDIISKDNVNLLIFSEDFCKRKDLDYKIYDENSGEYLEKETEKRFTMGLTKGKELHYYKNAPLYKYSNFSSEHSYQIVSSDEDKLSVRDPNEPNQLIIIETNSLKDNDISLLQIVRMK